MMRTISAILLSGILMASCSTRNEESIPETVKLRFKPEKGKVYNMVYDFDVKYDSSGEGTHFSIEVLNTVMNSDEEAVELECLYKGISMDGNIEGKEVKLIAGESPKDSSKAWLVASAVFGLKDQTFAFEYTPQARKVKEVMKDSDALPQHRVAESKVQFFVSYPDKELKKGDSWENEMDVKIGNKKIKKAMFTLKEIRKNEAVISIGGKLEGDGEKFGQEFSITGAFEGETIVDLETGWQKESKMEIVFVIHMMGKETPMHQSISYKMK